MGTWAWEGVFPLRGISLFGDVGFRSNLIVGWKEPTATHDRTWLWCQPVPPSELPAVCWSHQLAKSKKVNDFVH